MHFATGTFAVLAQLTLVTSRIIDSASYDEYEDVSDDPSDRGFRFDNSFGAMFVENDRSESEALLRTLLIHNSIYDRRRHPILNDSQAINVSVSLSLHSLIDIDDLTGLITINAEMGFKWYDWRLQWNPLSYSNLTVIPVRDDDIYHPDIVLLNGITVGTPKILAPSIALLHSDGKVLWYSRATLKTRCYVDAQNWPFTAMECDLKFGTPQYNTKEVNLYLHSKTVFLQLYIEHHKWKLIKGGQFMAREETEEVKTMFGKELPWVRIFLERRSNNFFLTLLAMPAVVVVLSGLFFACVNDPNANYIIGLLEFIFLSGLHVVLLQLIPSAEKVPVFILFVACGQLLVLSFLFTIPVIEFVKHLGATPPKWLILSARFCMFCETGRKKTVMTFNDANDMKVDQTGDWLAIALLLKFLLLGVYGVIFCAVTASSLQPLMGQPGARWVTAEANLDSLHTPFDS